MMFLVIFGSLGVAMAVVAQSNLRTADSALKVSRAMSAAETGLVFGSRRLSQQTARFVVEKGVIDASYAEELWLGTYSEGGDGPVIVLSTSDFVENTPPDGIIHAVRNAHLADDHGVNVDPGDSALPTIDEVYGTLYAKPIPLGDEDNAAYFRLRYELVEGEPLIRITSVGVDGDIRRTISMDFKIEKKIEFAVISPNRIMIGKNVLIQGPLGSRYGLVGDELASANGDPLVMRSDFYYLDNALSAKLDSLYAQVVAFDIDGDARLRPDHPTESNGLSGYGELVDHDGNEYVDDFDLFLGHYDANSNRAVVYDAALAASAGHSATGVEFSVDLQLARLIDESFSDRNGDDIVNATDRALGYMDGVLDVRDQYAKVSGRLAFAVAREPWEAENGAPYQTIVQGPIATEFEQAGATFEVSDDEMLEITTGMFLDSHTWFDAKSQTGATFGDESTGQVAAAIADGGVYIEPDDDTWEDVPFGATDAGGNAYDWYNRPVYRNMRFDNVRIPKGSNALFENCTFVGVTFIESEESCEHENWNPTGARERRQIVDEFGNPMFDLDGNPVYEYPLKFPGLTSDLDGTPIADTRPEANNIRFEDCTFVGSVAGHTPAEYTHWRNKVQFTGSTRFFVDPDEPDLNDGQNDLVGPTDAEVRSILGGMSAADREELAKSSILLPGWSVDVGNFNNEVGASPEDTAKIRLKGTIIAGILDVRGTADVHGTLLMTFRPETGVGPLFYGGLPDAFNTTIGYFGPSDGDGEGVDPDDATFDGFGEITLRYDPDAKLPDGIPWPVRTSADQNSYVEGGSL